VTRIGIVGGPGSGKSDLAQEIAKGLDGAVILDDYVEDISLESDVRIGKTGTYFGNLFVILGRLTRERKIEMEDPPEHLITCGTLIESAVYASMQGVEDQSAPTLARISAFMSMIGVLFQDTFHYTPLFVLPPGSENEWDQAMFRNNTKALEMFGYPFVILVGTTEERGKRALEIIAELEAMEDEEEDPLKEEMARPEDAEEFLEQVPEGGE